MNAPFEVIEGVMYTAMCAFNTVSAGIVANLMSTAVNAAAFNFGANGSDSPSQTDSWDISLFAGPALE